MSGSDGVDHDALIAQAAAMVSVFVDCTTDQAVELLEALAVDTDSTLAEVAVLVIEREITF